MNKNKSELFYELLKCSNYENLHQLSPKNFDYLFEIQEAKPFFDWFLTNVDKTCYLKKDEIQRFNEELAKGEVIWDYAKLKTIHDSMTNSKKKSNSSKFNLDNQLEEDIVKFDSFESSDDDEDLDLSDVENLTKDNEFLERKLMMLNKQNKFHQFCNDDIRNNLIAIKNKEIAEENTQLKFNEKIQQTKK